MNYHSVIFTDDEVRATLDRRKTMFRRVVKPQPEDDTQKLIPHGDEWLRQFMSPEGEMICVGDMYKRWKCPYGKAGDRIVVKETFSYVDYFEGDLNVHYKINDKGIAHNGIVYREEHPDMIAIDGDGFQKLNQDGSEKSPWKSPVVMPRWASRLTLEVEDRRVERLNEISQEDIIREGVKRLEAYNHMHRLSKFPFRSIFAMLWDRDNVKVCPKTNKISGHPWELNELVWVVRYKRVEEE